MAPTGKRAKNIKTQQPIMVRGTSPSVIASAIKAHKRNDTCSETVFLDTRFAPLRGALVF